MRSRNAKVASDRELRTATKSIAVHSRDHRDFELRDAVERCAHAPRHRNGFGFRAQVLKLLEGAAGAERLRADASNHQHPRITAAHILQRLVQLRHGL